MRVMLEFDGAKGFRKVVTIARIIISSRQRSAVDVVRLRVLKLSAKLSIHPFLSSFFFVCALRIYVGQEGIRPCPRECRDLYEGEGFFPVIPRLWSELFWDLTVHTSINVTGVC